MHVFARRGGNFELFWWKKDGVVRKSVRFALFVNQTSHVFARGVASLIRSGGNRNALSRVEWPVCFVNLKQEYACICRRGGGNFELSWCKRELVVQRRSQVCFVNAQT